MITGNDDCITQDNHIGIRNVHRPNAVKELRIVGGFYDSEHKMDYVMISIEEKNFEPRRIFLNSKQIKELITQNDNCSEENGYICITDDGNITGESDKELSKLVIGDWLYDDCHLLCDDDVCDCEGCGDAYLEISIKNHQRRENIFLNSKQVKKFILALTKRLEDEDVQLQ